MCRFPDCKKQSIYNFQGVKPAIYCGEHKSPGMINIRSKRCIAKDCITRPYYNFEGQTEGIYCQSHKQAGMINVLVSNKKQQKEL